MPSYKKNLVKHLLPELDGTNIILCTTSLIYYVWKNGECKRYDYWRDPKGKKANITRQEYFQKEVLKGVKKHLLVNTYGGYWGCEVISVQNRGDHISVVTTYLKGLSVKSFKNPEEHANDLSKQWALTSWNYVREFRIFKDRKVSRVYYHVFKNNSYISYVYNPKYNGRSGYYYGASFGETATDERTVSSLSHADGEGNKQIIVVDDANSLYEYAIKPSTSNNLGMCPSMFYAEDINKGEVHPCTISDRGHNSAVLSFADSTTNMITEFFQDTDERIWSDFKVKYRTQKITDMEYLLNFLQRPAAEKAAKLVEVRERKEAYFEELFNRLPFDNNDSNDLIFIREGNVLYVTINRTDNSPRNNHYYYYDRLGKAIFVLNLDTMKKGFAVKRDGQLSIQIPRSEAIIQHMFESPAYGYEDDNRWDGKMIYFRRYQQCTFIPSFEEVFKGTNIELLRQAIPAEETMKFNIGSDLSEECCKQLGFKTIHDILGNKIFSAMAWEVLLESSNSIKEQLLKQKYWHLYFALKCNRSNVTDLDQDHNNAWRIRLNIHSKAKNLKKYFGLTMKQIEIMENFAKDRINESGNEQTGYYDREPLIPAVAGMEEVFNVALNTMDLTTFTNLINTFSHQRGEYHEWFHWGDVKRFEEVSKLTKGMSPKDFINWYMKGFNLENYNDYLKMRLKLKLLAKDNNDPSLFSEAAYPEKIKDPDDVRRLHDIISKVTFACENKEKSERFSKACNLAKEYEFKDKDTQENGLMVVAPTAVTDLVYEGTELNHCVKSPMWVDAIADRSSVILFIRDKLAPNKPYFTMEVDPRTGNVRQCHGQCNSNPTKEIVEFLIRLAKAKPELINKASIHGQYSALCAPRD